MTDPCRGRDREIVENSSAPALEDDRAVALQSLHRRIVLVTPVRAALGLVWLAAAWAAGARPDVALLAFFVGCFATAAVLIADPRSRLAERVEPEEAPAGSTL